MMNAAGMKQEEIEKYRIEAAATPTHANAAVLMVGNAARMGTLTTAPMPVSIIVNWASWARGWRAGPG